MRAETKLPSTHEVIERFVANMERMRTEHPQAEVLVHPECGCATSVVEAVSAGDVDPRGVHILSTEGMIKRPGESTADTFIVATEVGILHRLRRAYPGKEFFAANERALLLLFPPVYQGSLEVQSRLLIDRPAATSGPSSTSPSRRRASRRPRS